MEEDYSGVYIHKPEELSQDYIPIIKALCQLHYGTWCVTSDINLSGIGKDEW